MKCGLHTLPQKPNSRQCIGVTRSPCKTKLKQTLSMFLTRRETVNNERYCESLQKLRLAVQNKWCGMLIDGVVLLHDNVRPHTDRWSTHLLQEISWETFNHPLYSLASSDFNLFLHLKKLLSGQRQRFQNNREVKMSVTQPQVAAVLFL